MQKQQIKGKMYFRIRKTRNWKIKRDAKQPGTRASKAPQVT